MPTQAYHFVVQRDHAKQLFAAAKDPAALAAFLAELAADVNLRNGEARLKTGDNWQALHDLLNNSATDSPLGQAILGGRPLSQDADHPVMLVRPDVVPAVADAFTKLKLLDDSVKEQILAIGKLFATAAQSGAAVVFAVIQQN